MTRAADKSDAEILEALVPAANRARAMRAEIARLAQRDPILFASYVLRDEQTGGETTPAPVHYAWHDLWSREARSIVWGHFESGKSAQVGARILWELGRDPSLRVVVVSNTVTQAKKFIRPMARYLKSSPELREVFPKLRPAEPWTAETLNVERQTISKDPSVQALGVHGNIQGARTDLLVIDDILDFENCRTPAGREDLFAWYRSALVGRMSARGRVWIVGNAFHSDDLLHRLARSPGWVAERFPVVDDDTGDSRWPERWPMARIDEARVHMGELEFARKMLCRARTDGDARFHLEWIDAAKARGNGMTMSYGLEAVPVGFRIVTGVDLGVAQHGKADQTVLATIAIYPNGDRQILCIESGRWPAPEIVNRIVDTHRRYQSVVWVESNAAQQFIVHFTRELSAVPVRSFYTGRNKMAPDFGIETLAVEMANSKWIFPSERGHVHREISGLIEEMLYWDPASHTGDKLMALWIAVAGSREGAKKAEVGRVNWGRR